MSAWQKLMAYEPETTAEAAWIAGAIVVGCQMLGYWGLWLLGGLLCVVGWVEAFCPQPLPPSSW